METWWRKSYDELTTVFPKPRYWIFRKSPNCKLWDKVIVNAENGREERRAEILSFVLLTRTHA